MSLSVVPQTGTPSWHATSLTKMHGTVKQLKMNAPVLGSTAIGGVAAATLAAAVAYQSSRGSQKRGACISIRAFESELGVQPPVGFWDPLGLAKDGDAQSFRRRRETELKHGRVAMIACIGYITPEFVRFPGFCSPSSQLEFSQIPNGLQAFSAVPGSGWLQMILFCLALEKGIFVQDPTRGPGDFKNGGVLGVPNKSTMPPGEERNRRLSAELANGRLAMMAIIGMFYQDGLTGYAWGDWSSYTDSPLRALETDGGLHAKTCTFQERGGKLGVRAAASSAAATFDITLQNGVTAPTGVPGVKYWDPAGLAKNMDASTFRQYRSAELKHGRICMVALGGLIAQHSWKLPAFRLEPSGIQAATSGHASAAGLALILISVGIIEYNSTDDGREPGDFGDPFDWIGQLETFDPNKPEELLLWRNRELNHCRLAMVGFLGTVMAEYATGYDAVEQWGHGEQAWKRTLAMLSFSDSSVGPLESF